MTGLSEIHRRIRDDIGYGPYLFGCIGTAAYVYIMHWLITFYAVGFGFANG